MVGGDLGISDWWLGIGGWAPQLRDALTRGLEIGEWGLGSGEWEEVAIQRLDKNA